MKAKKNTYVLTLDPSTLPADREYTITAVAYPNDGTATTLPDLKIQKDTASHNVLYTCTRKYECLKNRPMKS
jgi:hypothetical protein